MDNDTKRLDERKEVILAHERQFAAQLASQILTKPRLNAWMIFIPFIFIFYFQDLAKYKTQRKEFIKNYILSRKNSLNEVVQAMEDHRKPDMATLASQTELTGDALQKYGRLLAVLADHYACLLKGSGNDYPALVKSAYGRGQGNFLFFINQLNQAEKELNKALKPGLRKDGHQVGDTIRKMENHSNKLRRAEVKTIYA